MSDPRPPASTSTSAGRVGFDRPAGNPNDTSLVTVLAELDDQGWSGQFMPLEGGEVRCLTCRHEVPAAELPLASVRRLEGVSDPADMVIVVAVTCPRCATNGVLVAHYGPDGGPEDSDVVAALDLHPDGPSSVPPTAS